MTSGPDATSFDAGAFDRLRRQGGTRLVRDMIDCFLDDTPRRLHAAQAAVAGDDLVAAGRAAHSLKSTAATIGASQLSAVADRMEHAAAECDVPTVRTLLPVLEDAYRHATERLRTERGSFVE